MNCIARLRLGISTGSGRAAPPEYHPPPDPRGIRPPSPLAAPINRMAHARALATPAMRQGVAPNNDTLYSLGWLDTNDGPFVLETPDFGRRYYTFQMGQADVHPCRARPAHQWLPPAAGVHPGAGSPCARSRGNDRGSLHPALPDDRRPHPGRWRDDLAAVYKLQGGIKLRRWIDYSRSHDVLPPASPQRLLVPTRTPNRICCSSSKCSELCSVTGALPRRCGAGPLIRAHRPDRRAAAFGRTTSLPLVARRWNVASATAKRLSGARRSCSGLGSTAGGSTIGARSSARTICFVPRWRWTRSTCCQPPKRSIRTRGPTSPGSP